MDLGLVRVQLAIGLYSSDSEITDYFGQMLSELRKRRDEQARHIVLLQLQTYRETTSS